MTDQRLLEAKEIVNDHPDEALALCNGVLNEHMDDATAQQALFMAGYIMMQAERYGLAYNLYRRCAELNPGISEVWSNMGMCLEEKDPEEAKRCFRKAYELNPDNHSAYANEGLMCLQTGEPERCIELSERALRLDPSLRSATHNLGLAKLMLREWDEGWKLYHDTLGVKHREARDYGLPDWNGEPGTVVVYGEQGVGDEIMFASCLFDLQETNSILLDCDSRLEGLFRRTFDFPVYGTRFRTQTPLLDEHQPDYQLAIGQLPHFFRKKDADFPGNSYLKTDPERSLQWRALFDSLPGKKIGIAWRGGLKNTGEARRSLTLEDMEPLVTEGNTYISLEYKETPPEALEMGIKAYPRATAKGGDIDDLAALIGELDMVICPCTTVVYVAGALGIPCHVLVPDHPGYRYHMEGQFPWYSSVTLHRKTGTWRELTERVALDHSLYRLRPGGDGGVSRPLPVDSEPLQRAG